LTIASSSTLEPMGKLATPTVDRVWRPASLSTAMSRSDAIDDFRVAGEIPPCHDETGQPQNVRDSIEAAERSFRLRQQSEGLPGGRLAILDR
jgi:hypothetical protein